MNVKKILKSIKQNPLNELILKLEATNSDNSYNSIKKNLPEIHIIKEQYNNYYLSCERILNEISLERRFRNGPYFALKYRIKYTKNDRKLAHKYNQIKKYTELDFYNFILHTRILLDCVTRIAKHFIKGNNLPKFTSFTSHRNFFLKSNNHPYIGHEKYAFYIRDNTNWFENLRNVRDNILVHPKSSHFRFLGMSFGSDEFKLHIFSDSTISIPDENGTNVISVVEFIDCIEEFLLFFNKYGCGQI